MNTLYLLKTGEINLKGDNKFQFERQLFTNIKTQLSGIRVRIGGKAGRFFLKPLDPETPETRASIEKTLSSVFGLVGFSKAVKTAKKMDEIKKAVLENVENEISASGRIETFKIDAKRADKSFTPDSYQLSCILGQLVLENFPGLRVKVKNPDITVRVEIRDKAVIYSAVKKGPGGLPCGCAGKALLLLSGGIDSPVAGYLMARRGCSLEAVHFETYPFTSLESREKVIKIAEKISTYLPGMKLHIVPFTALQVHIRENCRPEETTLFSRAAMMEISHLIAEKTRANSIVTGECLSQVASQTAENIRFTGSRTTYPVLRPLIGFDKEDIIIRAREIGTYELSILPYPDCCSVFAPPRPLLKPLFSKICNSYSSMSLGKLVNECFSGTETMEIKKA